MKKGVQMFTVRDYLNNKEQAQETLNKIRAIGYDSIQAWTPAGFTHAEFKGMMDTAGLETFSANADFERIRDNEEDLLAAVEMARIYGVKDIAIGTLPVEMRESKEGFELFAKQVNDVTAKLKAYDMHLLYHPHALEFFSLGKGLKGMDIIMGETDPDGFWFALDTHWLASGGVSVTDWLRKAKGRMELVHFKDYSIVGGATTVETVCKNFAEVGEGNLDWPAIIEVCREIGVKGIAVEQDICPGDPFTSLEISFQNMIRFGL